MRHASSAVYRLSFETGGGDGLRESGFSKERRPESGGAGVVRGVDPEPPEVASVAGASTFVSPVWVSPVVAVEVFSMPEVGGPVSGPAGVVVAAVVVAVAVWA